MSKSHTLLLLTGVVLLAASALQALSDFKCSHADDQCQRALSQFSASNTIRRIGGAGARQFYVANTRYRGAHRIYVSNRKDILARLELPDFGRELATEFVERRRLTHAEFIAHGRLPRSVRTCEWRCAPPLSSGDR